MARSFTSSRTIRQRLAAVLMSGLASVALVGMAHAQQTGPAAGSMEAEIMAAAPELFGFLKGNFPQEFAGFVTTVEQTVASGGSLDGLVQNHLLELKQKYAANLAGAIDE